MLAAVWDNMRRIARERFEQGIMPEWFNPEWLNIEEAPMNTYWRQEGLDAYQMNDTWLGGNDGGDSGGKGGDGRGGKGWWREDDPYWPLRDWGDHPMRWWTFGFAAVMAGKQWLT